MDLILVAVAALVLLTVADARLWPDASSQNGRQPRGRWTPRRATPTRRLRRLGVRPNAPLGFTSPRRRTPDGPLWWWE
jgi:hypothetical protein